MQWIKEVDMVESVDDLRSSLSVRGIQMPNFEVLDARIASALNRINHNSHFKRRISLEEQTAQKEDRLLRGRQIAYLMAMGMRSPRHVSQLCTELEVRKFQARNERDGIGVVVEKNRRRKALVNEDEKNATNGSSRTVFKRRQL